MPEAAVTDGVAEASWPSKIPGYGARDAEPLQDRHAATVRRGDMRRRIRSFWPCKALRGWKRFLINNKPYFMRGGGEFFVMTDTVARHEPGSLEKAPGHGQAIRVQLYPAPVPCTQIPEYYDAADEVGLLVRARWASWVRSAVSHHGTRTTCTRNRRPTSGKGSGISGTRSWREMRTILRRICTA